MLQPKTLQARASKAYADQSRQVDQDQLIIDHLPLVKHIVNKVTRYARGRGDYDDMISAGTLGLVKAAKQFDPTREVEFKTYAYIRIRGAVIDEMRGKSFVPSGVHKQIKAIEQAYQVFRTSQGRPPDDEELAAEAGLDLDRMYKVLEEGRKQNFLSIHGLDNGQGPALPSLVPEDAQPGPAQQAQRTEMLEKLSAAILSLPKRDRHVLILYYERDLTMKETAAVLEVTESRVSQLHAAALFKLAMKMGVNK